MWPPFVSAQRSGRPAAPVDHGTPCSRQRRQVGCTWFSEVGAKPLDYETLRSSLSAIQTLVPARLASRRSRAAVGSQAGACCTQVQRVGHDRQLQRGHARHVTIVSRLRTWSQARPSKAAANNQPIAGRNTQDRGRKTTSSTGTGTRSAHSAYPIILNAFRLLRSASL